MASFSTLLVRFTEFTSKSFVRNSLKSMGVGLVSYTLFKTLFKTLFDQAMDLVRSSLGYLGEFFYAFQLAGINEFLSIIVFYISIKVYLKSKAVSLQGLK